MSRPPRARGLKQRGLREGVGAVMVAPPTGAWIETGYLDIRYHVLAVAPPTGAWIETSYRRI